MAVIDVGATCSGRGTVAEDTYWYVEESNPANDTGDITYVCIYWNTDPASAKAGSLSASGNDLTTTDDAQLEDRGTGQQEYESAVGDFTAFSVNSGDYIGAYGSSGGIEADTSGGVGIWRIYGDGSPYDSTTFSHYNNYQLSIYAEGTTAGGGETLIININDSFNLSEALD